VPGGEPGAEVGSTRVGRSKPRSEPVLGWSTINQSATEAAMPQSDELSSPSSLENANAADAPRSKMSAARTHAPPAKSKLSNLFWLADAFPDPAALIAFNPQPLQVLRDSALVVLDASTLLLPYGITSGSLARIGTIYR